MKTIIFIIFPLFVSTIGFSQTKAQISSNKEKTKITYNKVSGRFECRDNKGMLVYYIKQSKVSNRIEIRNKNNNLLQHYKSNNIDNYFIPCLLQARK